jgi:hypothetical protein
MTVYTSKTLNKYIVDIVHYLYCHKNNSLVIGELGMHGLDLRQLRPDTLKRVSDLRQAQQNVCLLDEFKNTTAIVRTAPYTISNGETYDDISHYWGRADTIFHIGQDFGNSMIHLLQRRK